ncbi:MAG: 2Fe-2S iron-sulfur cluster binding domain-containing protein [Flavonifractor sp.]|jgi:NADP-reducing hydrogenase subunit HndD|nr:2Fe-2S iron-sulfur cluster binding domain-containing protein [Flavonifractor sp.]
MSKVHIKINNMPLEVEGGTLLIDAARQLGIDIPHMCYHHDQESKAHCRLCVVEVKGQRKLQTSCTTPVSEGMEVFTDTQKVYDAQVGILELMLADHKQNCLSCARNGNCELQTLCRRFNLLVPDLPDISSSEPLRVDNPSIVRDPAKCVKCGRCVKTCRDVQGIAALTYSGRSAGFRVTTAFDLPMAETDCVLCGQCSLVCPVGAIVEEDSTAAVRRAIQDPAKHVVVQVAPSVRVALGDEFGFAPGAIVTGQMTTALRMLGFDKVFDTNFAADLTIMEEGSELLERLNKGGKLPLITSCSPGWVTFVEKHHPELMEHLSTAKSPQGMFGAVVKTYYAQQMGWDPHDIVSVSVMPCTAKKFEARRPELGRDGYQDVDYVLTTRELAKLIRYEGLELKVLPESEFDSPLGTATGAGAIFGATGGVMEAALRTAYELYTGKTLKKLEFEAVRGFDGIKEAVIDLNGTPLKVAVAHTLKNADELLKRAHEYAFLEIMACPGGCIGGGGQPIGTDNALRQKRIDALYRLDASLPLRKSHENPEIKAIYERFFTAPLSHKAHELLHTHYQEQNTVSKIG